MSVALVSFPQVQSFGFGQLIPDPLRPERVWRVTNSYGEGYGARCRVVDVRGFVSFISMVDLLVLTRSVRAGEYCEYLGMPFPEVGNHADGWRGFHVTEQDAEEDLWIQESVLRQSVFSSFGLRVMPQLDMTRFMHVDEHIDEAWLESLLWDCDRETGEVPDCKRSTVHKRWVRTQRERMVWETCTTQ